MTTDTPPNGMQIKQSDRLTSLERGLRVLRTFDQHSVEMTPAEVAKKTDLPRAATRRVLLTLCELGYAVTDGKHFRLTPKVLDLSHGYLAKTRIRDLIEPVLREAVLATKESCILAILDGDDTISTACINSNTFGAVNVSVGLRIPLYVSTPGRLFLADMPPQQLSKYLSTIKPTRFTPHTIVSKTALREELIQVHEQGYALGAEEWELGVYALAVPVRARNGKVVAALSCIGNAARIKADKAISQRLTILRDAAARISAVLPDTPDFTQELQISDRR